MRQEVRHLTADSRDEYVESSFPPPRIGWVYFGPRFEPAHSSPDFGKLPPAGAYTAGARYPLPELERTTFESIQVIGAGRVGSAISARLSERGVAVRDEDAELVLICVP